MRRSRHLAAFVAAILVTSGLLVASGPGATARPTNKGGVAFRTTFRGKTPALRTVARLARAAARPQAPRLDLPGTVPQQELPPGEPPAAGGRTKAVPRRGRARRCRVPSQYR